MAKTFASEGDTQDKIINFTPLSANVYAYIADGDPNCGAIIGDDAVLVIDALATPVMAREHIRLIRTVTDKPIKYLCLTHYHAVRVLGASAFGAEQIVASRGTYDLIAERGEADRDSEIGRFPRLFRSVESIPGMTWPTMTFDTGMSIRLGRDLEVRLLHLGRAHTKGDTVVWIPSQRIAFTGDAVEYNTTIYAGDGYLTDWPRTLDAIAALGIELMVPGRGPVRRGAQAALEAIDYTRRFATGVLDNVRLNQAAGKSLRETYLATRAKMDPVFGHVPLYEHSVRFNVARAYDEVRGIVDPAIWTAERDRALWAELDG